MVEIFKSNFYIFSLSLANYDLEKINKNQIEEHFYEINNDICQEVFSQKNSKEKYNQKLLTNLLNKNSNSIKEYLLDNANSLSFIKVYKSTDKENKLLYFDSINNKLFIEMAYYCDDFSWEHGPHHFDTCHRYFYVYCNQKLIENINHYLTTFK